MHVKLGIIETFEIPVCQMVVRYNTVHDEELKLGLVKDGLSNEFIMIRQCLCTCVSMCVVLWVGV